MLKWKMSSPWLIKNISHGYHGSRMNNENNKTLIIYTYFLYKYITQIIGHNLVKLKLSYSFIKQLISVPIIL